MTPDGNRYGQNGVRESLELDGLVVIDKESGWTSHDVVAKARGVLGTRKVGHAGTLDPDASGLLLLGVGRATRLLRFIGDRPKTYTGTVVLGETTATQDSSGESLARFDMSDITIEQVRLAARTLTGSISQVPPMVSAKRQGGKRLYELARSGIEVDRAPVDIVVWRFDVIGPSPYLARSHSSFLIEVECSSGTYVRTLAADLGTLLGGGAHLHELRRTAIGSFNLDEAVKIGEMGLGSLMPIKVALRDFDCVRVDEVAAEGVRHGAWLPGEIFAGPGPWAVEGPGGTILAVYERRVGLDEGLKAQADHVGKGSLGSGDVSAKPKVKPSVVLV